MIEFNTKELGQMIEILKFNGADDNILDKVKILLEDSQYADEIKAMRTESLKPTRLTKGVIL